MIVLGAVTVIMAGFLAISICFNILLYRLSVKAIKERINMENKIDKLEEDKTFYLKRIVDLEENEKNLKKINSDLREARNKNIIRIKLYEEEVTCYKKAMSGLYGDKINSIKH